MKNRNGTRRSSTSVVGILVFLFLLPFVGQAQPQQFMLAVPYHSQVPPGDPNPAYVGWPWPEPGNANTPNGFCTCACIEMLFDYYEACWHNNPPLPQQEIAAVANTNDVMNTGSGHRGTYLDDARRAVHFSTKTGPWPSAPPPYIQGGVNGRTGYSWRTAAPCGAVRGYVGIDGSWTGNGWTMNQLKQTIALGYPIMTNVDGAALARHAADDTTDSDYPYNVDVEPECTTVGHSIVVRGYRNHANPNLNCFFIRDPARGPAWIVPQQAFWDSVWTSKDFLFVAPWQSSINVPPLGSFMPNGFAITGTSTYQDGLPALGTGTSIAANQAKGRLSFKKKNPFGKMAAALAQGQVPVIPFNPNGPMTSGTSLQKSWQCVTTAYDTCIAEVETYGIVSTTSTSFAGGYTDEIGSFASDTLIVPKPVAYYDPSICRIPRTRWWQGSHIPVIPGDYAPGNANTFWAEIVNRGDIPATSVMVEFYYGDPALAEFCPDPVMSPFASTVVPFIAPGDSLLCNSVTFWPPTGNSFGEDYYNFVVALHAAGDPPHEIWVELDNNIACRSVHQREVTSSGPVGMQFFAVNPFPDANWVVTRLEATMPEDWLAELGPPGTDSVYMAPEERQPRFLVVDVGRRALGTIHVCEDVYDTDGNFLRRTGGLLYEVSYEPTGALLVDEGVRAFTLAPPWPNPATTGATLSFALPEAGYAELALFDVAGRRVSDIYVGAAPAGFTRVPWDGCDTGGARVAAGVYFVRLTAGEEQRTRKLLVIR